MTKTHEILWHFRNIVHGHCKRSDEVMENKKATAVPIAMGAWQMVPTRQATYQRSRKEEELEQPQNEASIVSSTADIPPFMVDGCTHNEAPCFGRRLGLNCN